MTENPSSTSQEKLASDTLASAAIKVLVVDDSKTVRRSALSLLAREGFDVQTAGDGFEALAAVVRYQPDIVFVDVIMPRLDGYQTCALIKNSAEYGDTAVVMLSSKDSIFDKARGRVVGAQHYITKPFTGEDLVAAVRRYHQSRQLRQPQQAGDNPRSENPPASGLAAETG